MAERIETGRMQIGTDWPGTFIRGDDSLFYAQTIRALFGRAEDRAKSGNVDGAEAAMWGRLQKLADILEGCRVNKGAQKVE